MSETKSLLANLLFTVDDESAKSLSEQIEKAVGGIDVGIKTEGGGGGSSQSSGQGPAEKTAQKTEEMVDALDEQTEETKDNHKVMGSIMEGLTTGVAVGLGLLQGGFDILKGAWTYIKGKVPLLKDIVEMFTSVVDLVWLPFGIALAENMLPFMEIVMGEVMGLVQQLFAIYEDKGIVGLFTEGIGLAVGFLFNTGIKLLNAIPEDCLIGKISHTLADVMEWIWEHIPKIEELIKTVTDIVEWVLDNIKVILSVLVGFVAFKMTSDSLGLLGMIPGASLLFGGIAGGVAGGLTYGALTSAGLAEGGYVEPTDGGSWVNVAEGGEREYIVPQSKVKSFANAVGGGNTINNYYYINGYTDSELKDIIINTINDSANRSRLRGDY